MTKEAQEAVKWLRSQHIGNIATIIEQQARRIAELEKENKKLLELAHHQKELIDKWVQAWAERNE